ncbi:MAG: glycosyltransferase family 2 protein [Bryobacteraceae bacterium]
MRLSPSRARFSRLAKRLSLAYYGVLLLCFAAAIYFAGILLSIIRLTFFFHERQLREWNTAILWYSGLPATVAVLLIAIDLIVVFPMKRRTPRRLEVETDLTSSATVVLTAYNDEASIRQAVADFRANPRVARVIVVENNSRDGTAESARESGAIVVTEKTPGYGRCVYRCLQEALRYDDTDYIVLCEGDRTFRAQDIHKLFAFIQHADVVNGTRIVEQLRGESTQLTTFMYYGNFFVGKLFEVKHLGKGTFTDMGTTYKMIRRNILPELLMHLDPRVNLEFNAHFMDTVLRQELLMIECPVTFHPRVGVSKGGNVNNLRALCVGLRMILGLTCGWRMITRGN